METMTTIPFDTLKLARALRDKAKFTPEQAEGVADALADAMTGAELVTKDYLDGRLIALEQRLTIKLGSMLVVAIGVIAALVKLL
jgi:hypothetical protein